MAEFHRACRVEDAEVGRGLEVVIEGVSIAIFNDGGTFHALRNRCPHQGTPIAEGRIEDGEAICPEHYWRFKLSTGRCTNVRGNTLHRFACEVRGGEVWVAV